MKYISIFSFFFAAFFIISCKNSNNAKINFSNENMQTDDYSLKIDSLIQTTSPRKFNGVVLIPKIGNTMYSKAFGYSDFEHKTPIQLEDNFRIQSISKQITAVLILREVDKGKIDLKSPIKRYFPEIKQSWTDDVTVHHLLNMSSGIISLDKPLLFEHGTEFYYSNAGYGLLGRIIEKVTGKTYIEVANDLFKNLNMQNSYCYELGMTNNTLINGYNIEDSNNYANLIDIDSSLSYLPNMKEWWKNFIPTGGIISNLNDLSIWDTNIYNGKLLKPDSYALMIGNTNPKRTDFFKAYGNESIGYGYGVCVSDKPLINIGHPGKGLGFCSFKFYVPEKKLNVIVLQNLRYEDSNIVFHFEKEIRDIVLNSSLVKQ